MLTAIEYRARADSMDEAAEASPHEAETLQCRAMAQEWRWLARTADWQEAMIAKGHPGH